MHCPVALPLERVGGQHDLAPCIPTVKALPVDGASPHVEFTQAGEHCLPLPLPRAERGQEGRFCRREHAPACCLQSFARHAHQHRFGADFQKNLSAQFLQSRHTVGKTDSLHHVTHPVVRPSHLFASDFAGHSRDHAHSRGAVANLGCHLLERLQHRFHKWRVEGVRDLQPLAFDPFQTFDNCLHCSTLSRKHDADRAVDRCNREGCRLRLGALPGCNGSLHACLAGLQCNHGAFLRQRTHQPSARSNQLQPILQAEDPGYAGRCDLSHTVAEQQIRFPPPGKPERGQRILQGKKSRLCIFGAVDGICIVLCRLPIAQHLQQRRFHLPGQQFSTAVKGLAEEGLRRVKFLPHADNLRALAGEEKGELGPQLLFGLFS